MKLVLLIIAILCALGWLAENISGRILVWYIKKSGIPLPSKADVDAGFDWAIHHIFDKLASWKGKGE